MSAPGHRRQPQLSISVSTGGYDPFLSPTREIRDRSISITNADIPTTGISRSSPDKQNCPHAVSSTYLLRSRRWISQISRWRFAERWIALLTLSCVVVTLFILGWRNMLRQRGLASHFPYAHSHSQGQGEDILPDPAPMSASHHDPQQWFSENTEEALAIEDGKWWWSRRRQTPRPRAAIISLVRNEELEGIMQSMRQLEYRWNSRYGYPWVFFNDKPFSEEFKAKTTNLTSAKVYYELIPVEHWSTPEWVDEERYMNSLDYLGTIGVGKGWMLSYRNMCRWNSGFFYKHPRLQEFDYYWRVEPDVHFYCKIPYDPFRFLRDNNLIYGFNMAILDDARSFPSLWPQTRQFILDNPRFLHRDADLTWLLDPAAGGIYNNCQFFSNFEIGDLRFFRGQANEEYFRYLDERGGFYYERFGDAPIHTLSVALFAGRRQSWYFGDIGYQHEINRHCPGSQDGAGPAGLGGFVGGKGEKGEGRCECQPTRLDENFYKLVPLESPQLKPRDTCIRLWLDGGREGSGKGVGGVDWLKKREGWSQDADKAFGGDGYGGYVNS